MKSAILSKAVHRISRLGIDLHHMKRTRGLDLAVWPPRYDAGYLPHTREEYWFEEIECAEATAQEEIIFFKLTNQIRYAWERSPFYRRRWQEAGVSPDDLKVLSDLARFPVVQKSDLRELKQTNPPFGDALCVGPDEITRIHGTSGTTGHPVVFGIGREDWARIGNAHARILWSAGLRPSDRIMICSFFSLYVGSWGALVGGERLGAAMFPFGAGVAGQTVRAVEWAQAVKPTAFYGTPSYAIHFADVARQEGVDPRSIGFKTLFFSGEPGAGIPSTKRLIEDAFGGACIDMGSMAEMTPWMTNSECRHRTGMHLWQDIVYTELCDPTTYKPVPYGAEGTPVYTHLERTSQPMIRLASNDRSLWTNDPCPCGRTYPRLPQGIFGRYDDMLTIRGENVYPSAIEDVLRAVEGFGGEFQVIISRHESMDELLIRAEHLGSYNDPHLIASLRARMEGLLRARLGVRPVIELVPQGHLHRAEFKSRRTIDNRNLYREFLSKNSQNK
jgi:phenylacetate-CoA ligase